MILISYLYHILVPKSKNTEGTVSLLLLFKLLFAVNVFWYKAHVANKSIITNNLDSWPCDKWQSARAKRCRMPWRKGYRLIARVNFCFVLKFQVAANKVWRRFKNLNQIWCFELIGHERWKILYKRACSRRAGALASHA